MEGFANVRRLNGGGLLHVGNGASDFEQFEITTGAEVELVGGGIE